jgi:hypothetical protein
MVCYGMSTVQMITDPSREPSALIDRVKSKMNETLFWFL